MKFLSKIRNNVERFFTINKSLHLSIIYLKRIRYKGKINPATVHKLLNQAEFFYNTQYQSSNPYLNYNFTKTSMKKMHYAIYQYLKQQNDKPIYRENEELLDFFIEAVKTIAKSHELRKDNDLIMLTMLLPFSFMAENNGFLFAEYIRLHKDKYGELFNIDKSEDASMVNSGVFDRIKRNPLSNTIADYYLNIWGISKPFPEIEDKLKKRNRHQYDGFEKTTVDAKINHFPVPLELRVVA